MKFKILLFTIFLLGTNVIFSQNQGRKITLKKDNKKEKSTFQKLDIEKAKYRKKYKIKEISHFNIQIKGELNSSSKKHLKCKHFFDNKGREISIEFYQTASDTTNFFNRKPLYKIGQLTSFSKFEYDKNGILIREMNYSSDGNLVKIIEEKQSLPIKNKLKLDSLKITYYSTLLDKIRFYSFIKNKFKFDKSKRVKSWIATNKSSSQKTKYFYYYEGVGFIRKEIHYNSLNNISYSVIKNYNKNGFETKSKRYLKDNILNDIIETDYVYYE